MIADAAWRRITVRDETLPHQIVIMQDGISCNCRRYKPPFGGVGYEIFAPFTSDEKQTWAYYNDPANHRGEIPLAAGQ